MYTETEENRFLEVTYANGDKEVLYFKDFNSGAMIQNIVDRAKKMAIKDFLEHRAARPARAPPAPGLRRRVQGERGPARTPPTPTTGRGSPARRASGSSSSARSSPASRAPSPVVDRHRRQHRSVPVAAGSLRCDGYDGRSAAQTCAARQVAVGQRSRTAEAGAARRPPATAAPCPTARPARRRRGSGGNRRPAAAASGRAGAASARPPHRWTDRARGSGSVPPGRTTPSYLVQGGERVGDGAESEGAQRVRRTTRPRPRRTGRRGRRAPPGHCCAGRRFSEIRQPTSDGSIAPIDADRGRQMHRGSARYRSRSRALGR